MRRARSRWRINTVRSATFLAGATLDMGFARGAYLGATVSSLTVTRASDAYADDEVGNWSLFGSGVARVTNKGLLVEEARTNSIRNNSMQGAVAGTQGTAPTNWSRASAIWTTDGLNYTTVGVGTENGVEYIDIRVNGTPSNSRTGISIASFDGATAIAALSGQAWTSSAFVKIVSGSTTNVTEGLLVSEHDAGGTFLTGTTTAFVPTGTLTRVFCNRTLNNASTAFVQSAVVLNYTSGLAFDITLRIGWPQIELGAFATSPIRTTAGAATRAADVVSLQGANFSSWYGSPVAFTMFVEANFAYPAATYAGSQEWGAISDNTANNRAHMFRTTAGAQGNRIVSGGVATNPGDIVGLTAAGIYKSALAIAVGASQGIAVSNATLSTASTPTALPVSPDRFYIGVGTSGTGPTAAYIRRVAYIPLRLSNAELQAITT